MLQLLSLPCMQHATDMHLTGSSRWVDSPLVQTAVLGLPRLDFLDMAAGPETKLLPSAFALASKLTAVNVEVWGEHPPPGSLRALRLAPALTSLSVGFYEHLSPLPRDLPWCLPPTLTDLSLLGVDVSRAETRPLLKALFSHTPLLVSLELSSVSLAVILRGLLDAGMAALPSLRSVKFESIGPADVSVGIQPDLLEPIFRRFVHRFPQAIVRIVFDEDAWDDMELLLTVQLQYAGWPSVELYWTFTDERISGPPVPHPSDDDPGSDVDVLEDPLASEERSCSDNAGH